MMVLVIGVGVIGLTAAVRLLEAGHRVEIVARERPEDTTSAVAAALWYPYRAAPPGAVTRWAAVSFAVLSELAADPSTGVRLRRGTELLRRPAAEPWWRDAVPALEHLGSDAVPDGYAGGFRLTAPLVDMSRHLPWLVERVHALGGTLEAGTVGGLDEACALAPVVVNATGLGARELVPDPSMSAVRGQVVLVEQVGVEEWLLDQGDAREPIYIVPRGEHIVLGGTAEEGAEGAEPHPATAAAVLERCRDLMPALQDAAVVGHQVGLRPARPSVRLETEQRRAGTVVHCYGHGGAGVTLSWGCAADVTRAVDRLSTAG